MSSDFVEPDEWATYIKSMRKVDPGDSKSTPFGTMFGHVVEPTSLEDMGQYDVVLVGEPYDRGHILGKPGARYGPATIREGLANTKTHHLDNGNVDLSIADLGDVRIPKGKNNQTQLAKLREVANTLHERDVFSIFFGGDHSVTYPNAAPLIEQYESVGIVNFDSHDDLLEPINGEPHSASNFRQLCEEGLEVYTIVGARPFGVGQPSFDYLTEHGGMAISSETVGDDPIGAVNTALDSISSVDAIFVTLDIDVVEMALVPGTSAPYPGGLLPRELFRAVRTLLLDDRVKGLDLVEVADVLDDSRNTTSMTAGRVIAHAISGINQREENQ
jgi:formiminoglutamase/agmatinase